MFTNETINFLFIVPMFIDLLTYCVNGILICVVGKKMNTIIGPTLFDKSLEVKRLACERLITKSVLKTVSYHFLMTTMPAIPLILLSVAFDKGWVTDDTFYAGLAFASWLTFMESMVNVYVYVTTVPHLKTIVLNAFTW